MRPEGFKAHGGEEARRPLAAQVTNGRARSVPVGARNGPRREPADS